MMAQPQSLPVRPRRNPDEWIETYLGRIARCIGIKRPWRDDLELLRDLIPFTAEYAMDGAPRYGALPVPDWAAAGRGSKIQYCPACMVEARFIRSRWRLAHFEVCTVHGIRLKDDLVEPAFTANYQRHGRQAISVATSEQLWEGATCPMRDELDHVTGLWSAFETAAVVEDREGASRTLAWTLLIERLLDALATSVRGIEYPSKYAIRANHRAAWAKKYNIVAQPNHDAVLALLDGLRLPAHRRAAMRCLAYLVREELRKKTCLSSLPLQSLHDRVMALRPEDIYIKGHGALPRRSHPEGYLSFEATEALVGCPGGVLAELLRIKALSDVRHLSYGRKRYQFIRSEEAFACRRWFHSLMSLDELKERLQIDRSGYAFLVRAGLLHSIRISGRAWIRTHDVQSLLSKLEDASLAPPGNGTKLFAISQIWTNPRGIVQKASMEAVVGAITGRHRLYRKAENPGLSAFFVEAELLEDMRRSSAMYRRTSIAAPVPESQLSFDL